MTEKNNHPILVEVKSFLGRSFINDLEQPIRQYFLLLMGWQKDECIKSVMIYIRLKDHKIWIEENCTEEGVITDLLAKGITTTKEVILAFHPPHIR